MTIKTDVSRFHIHDELTAPDATAPLIKSIQTAGGAVSKFIGVLAESPAALRSYMRLRSELRKGELTQRHARADRPRTRRAPGRRLHAQPVRPHGPRRGARPRRGRPRPRVHLLGREGGGAAGAAAGHARARQAAPQPPGRGGARGRLVRRPDPRGARRDVAGDVPEHRRHRRRAAARELGPGGAALGRGLRRRLRRAWRRAAQPAGVTVAAIGPAPTVRKPSRLAVFFVRSQA